MVKIIGITGTFGAGKGTLANFLQKKGFKHYSMSEYITQEIIKRKLPINRDSMIFVANDLRKKNGSSYIAEQLFKEAQKEKKDCVIESLRTKGEIDSLKNKGNFYLFSIDAKPKLRFERMMLRKSKKDAVSFEKFSEQEKSESNNKDPTKQNLIGCIKLADFKFKNNGTIKELHDKIEEVLNEIEKK